MPYYDIIYVIIKIKMEIKILQGKRWFIWTLVIATVVLLGLASYIFIVSENDNRQVSAVLINHKQKTQSQEKLDTYTNAKYGFTFQYPDSFEFKGGYIYQKSAGFGNELGGSILTNFFPDKSFGLIRSRVLKIAYTQSDITDTYINLGVYKVNKISYLSDFGSTITDYIFVFNNLTFDFTSDGVDKTAEEIITSIK